MPGRDHAIRQRGDRAAARRAHLRDVKRRIPGISKGERALRVAAVRNCAEIRRARIDRENRSVLRQRGV